MPDPINARGSLDLPGSLWAATAEPQAPTSNLDGQLRADVAIVGGGYTGLSAALHLAEAGVDAVVLEAGEPGFGASGRNGGQVIPGLKHDPDTLVAMFGENRGRDLVAFAGETAERTFELIRRHAIACDARQSGWLQPAPDAAKLEKIYARAEQWSRHAGVDARLMGRADVTELTGTDSYVGGWIDPRGGTVQPLSYARGLARAATDAGARVVSRALVRELSRGDGSWTVSTDTGQVQADRVILATNGYTGGLWPGLERTVLPATSVQVATEPLTPELRDKVLPGGYPVSDARRLLNYMHVDAAGRFVIGGRGSFGGRMPERHFRRLRRLAVRMFPGLSDVAWSHSWGGTVALTLDGLPHLHELAPGVYAGLGFNGRGVAMATQVGRLLAQAARGMPADDLPLPFSAPRPLPLHGLRQPAMEAAATWYRALDRMGW
jgi:glycine/D-amino acid oxidase-like deaminating enzyme